MATQVTATLATIRVVDFPLFTHTTRTTQNPTYRYFLFFQSARETGDDFTNWIWIWI